ncbi:YbgA family protein [Enterococcus sp. LJL99]
MIGAKQKEWAILKYLILSKSQNDYRQIRKLFQNHSWDAEKEAVFQALLQHAMAEPPKKGNLINAYQHVWGYFKTIATLEEKKHYEQLLIAFSIDTDELKPFLKQLTLKYQESYLLQSALLFEEKGKQILKKECEQ